ncbi:hypothetical protein FRB91_010656 [Serendipita sp. 411]|nr:hypothetical protein FRC15_010000 [Serendipita sp. 397]KAG8848611.1 hypothetical protein FRB91_010656 [Serendipita sp. 411]
MRHSLFTVRILVWIISLCYVSNAQDQDVFIPAWSPMMLYDDGWSNYTNPNYRTTRNGVFYFMYRGSNITIHCIPQNVGPSLNVWLDGNTPVNMTSYANYSGVSSIDSTLTGIPVTLGPGDHQVQLSYHTPDNTSFLPFVFGGISVTPRGYDDLLPYAYGVKPTRLRVDRIMDDSLIDYSGPWSSENQSFFAYNKTSTTLDTVGSSLSFKLPQDASIISLHGSSSSVTSIINMTLSSPANQSTVQNGVTLDYTGKNVSLVQVPLWTFEAKDAPVVAGSIVDIVVDQGELNIDYILLQFTDKPVDDSKKLTAIVVPVVVVSLIIAGSIGFWLWRRRRSSKLGNNSEIALKDLNNPSGNQERQEADSSHRPYQSRSEISLASQVVPPRVSPNLVPLPSSAENATSSQSGTTASGSLPSNSNSRGYPSEPREHDFLGLPGSGSPRAESLPIWSPPPPSYQSISYIASEEAQSRGMMPLSQEALERLYQRVIVLRRANHSFGQGGDKLHLIPEADEEEFDEELEALARRIAGIGAPARPEMTAKQ